MHTHICILCAQKHSHVTYRTTRHQFCVFLGVICLFFASCRCMYVFLRSVLNLSRASYYHSNTWSCHVPLTTVYFVYKYMRASIYIYINIYILWARAPLFQGYMVFPCFYAVGSCTCVFSYCVCMCGVCMQKTKVLASACTHDSRCSFFFAHHKHACVAHIDICTCTCTYRCTCAYSRTCTCYAQQHVHVHVHVHAHMYLDTSNRPSRGTYLSDSAS